MRLYAGLDVSLEKTAICVIDQDGKIIQEVVAPTHAEAIADVLEHHRAKLERIGLEAAPTSEWLLRRLGSTAFRLCRWRRGKFISPFPPRR